MSNKETRSSFFHVTHDNTTNKWYVKEVKGVEIKVCKNKEEAIKEAEIMAKNAEISYVVIHDEKGRFTTFEHFAHVG